MGIRAASRSWLVGILLLCCIINGSAREALLSMNFGAIMFGLDSSNQNAGLLGQFTYSTSFSPYIAWKILQDLVCQFMFILIKLPTLNIFVINGHKETQVL